MNTSKIEKPLLIWTLQRTGGTNLSNFLNRKSAQQKLQDEPFNGRRECGYLTKNFKETKDQAALLAGMREVCSEQRNIKHCVERVPWAISDALISASIETGYLHMFLYRQNPFGRLLSMEYAERTRSWGPSKVLKDGQDAEAFVEPLDVDALWEHEAKANERLNKIWRKIIKQGGKPFAVSFEEIYAADVDSTSETIKRIAELVGLPTDAEFIADMADEVRGKGNQGTSDRYARFKRRNELEARIADLPRLRFSKS